MAQWFEISTPVQMPDELFLPSQPQPRLFALRRGLLASVRSTPVLVSTLLAALSLTGCMSKSQAQAQARMAYLAGQRDAVAELNRNQNPVAPPDNMPSNITFIGPVENPVISWTEGLTLGKAILTAVYHSQIDPTMITILRSNAEHQIDPARLLSGQDFPLLPGDVVRFHLPAQ